MATATATAGQRQGTKKAKVPDKIKKTRAKRANPKDPVRQATYLQELQAENPNITADQLAERWNMPLEEVIKYRAFIHEYLKDYNAEYAALRLGYPDGSAASTGKLFLYHSFTQLRLAEIMEKAEADAICTAAQLHANLWKEANAKDVPFSSNSSTRIQATKILMQAKGLLNPKPIEVDVNIKRVMYIPAPCDWEAGARASQKALKESTVIDV